jgi:hypothetical protein
VLSAQASRGRPAPHLCSGRCAARARIGDRLRQRHAQGDALDRNVRRKSSCETQGAPARSSAVTAPFDLGAQIEQARCLAEKASNRVRDVLDIQESAFATS